jgi:hypothetical protein
MTSIGRYAKDVRQPAARDAKGKADREGRIQAARCTKHTHTASDLGVASGRASCRGLRAAHKHVFAQRLVRRRSKCIPAVCAGLGFLATGDGTAPSRGFTALFRSHVAIGATSDVMISALLGSAQ